LFQAHSELLIRNKPTFIILVCDTQIFLYDYNNPNTLKTIKNTSETKGFTNVNILNETQIIIGTYSGTVLVWDLQLADFTKFSNPEKHNLKPILRVNSTNDGKIISVGNDGKICIWKISNNPEIALLEIIKEINGDNENINSCDFYGNSGILSEISNNLIAIKDYEKNIKNINEKCSNSIEKITFLSENIMIGFEKKKLVLILQNNSKINLINIEMTQINETLTKIINCEINKQKPNLCFLAGYEGIFKLDFTNLLLPKIIYDASFITKMTLPQIKLHLNDAGNIIKPLDSKGIYNSENSQFYYSLSGKDILCTTFIYQNTKNIITNQITSKISNIIPENISQFYTYSYTKNTGYLLILIRCELSGNFVIFKIDKTNLGPIFTIEKIFSEHCLAFCTNSDFSLYFFRI